VLLVDTSVWIDVFSDRTGQRGAVLAALVGEEDLVLSRIHQLELLQGSRDEREWQVLADYLEEQEYLELTSRSWNEAARIYFDLRRRALTVRSPLDCCIAQLALEHGATLLHRDRDFEAIGRVRPLLEQWVDW
jgi:predicted nucleic acid-binding protein